MDSIQKKPVEKFISTCNEAIQKYSPENLHILFSSPGGNINLAFVLYAYLRAIPLNIIMHGAGVIDSCAINVFLAGNQRFASKGATFLLHSATRSFTKDSSYTIDQLHSELVSLQEDQKKVLENILDNTTYTPDDLKRSIMLGLTLNTEQAKEKGIITEIKEFSVQKNSPFLQVDKNEIINQKGTALTQ